MANRESVRPARNTATTKGKLRKKSGEPLRRTLDAYWEKIQQSGWTAEIEAEVFAAPAQLQVEPELLERLMTEAGQRDDVKLWRLLACINESKENEQAAAACASAVLQLQPTDTLAMGVLARLCEKRQAEQEAVGWHRRILEVEPTQINSIRFLALMHYQRGEYETALQHFNHLIELEPKGRAHKLYCLLSTVKHSGVHGLAQPLTEVRRWRTLAPEEVPLAHELFLLVAKLCLHARQRARAKQYLTRAMQLDPTPEVEALLAEASDQPLPAVKATLPTVAPMTSAPVKTPVAIPHPSGPIRLKYPVVPHPPVVLPEGAWNGRPRIMPFLTSGVGAIAALVLVAVLVIWSLPDDPPLAPLPPTREKRAALPNTDVASSVAKQEMAALNQKPIETKKSESPTPAPKTLAQASAPMNASKPEMTPQPTATQPVPVAKPVPEAIAQTRVSASPASGKDQNQTGLPAPVTQPVPAKPATEAVAQARVPVPLPPAKEPNRSTQPVNAAKPELSPRPNVTQPVPAKPASENVSAERVGTPAPTPSPSVPTQQRAEKPVPAAPITVAKETATSAPPGSLNIHSSPSFYAPATPESPPPPSQPVANMTDSPKPGASTTAAVVEKAKSPAPAIGEKPKPLTPPMPQPALTKAPTKEKTETAPDEANVAPAVAFDAKREETPERRPVEQQTIAAKSEPETPPSATAKVATMKVEEPQATSETHPAKKEDDHNIVASAADVAGQPIPTPEESQTPKATETRAEEDNRTAVANKETAAPQAGDSPRIARLSSRLPHASRFPVRERLVSVPPEKLMSEMPELMKQEIGDSTVRKISPGVIRARVSGKPRDPARPPKEYGQYLIEIVPGPTEGTSLVRSQVLLFNWRTGDPIVDADERADQLLKKIPD